MGSCTEPPQGTGPRARALWHPNTICSLPPGVCEGGPPSLSLISPPWGVPGAPGLPEVSDLDLWGTPRAQEATSSCERAHLARGQNLGLARAMGDWIPIVFVLDMGGAQITRTPTEPGARPAQVHLG